VFVALVVLEATGGMEQAIAQALAEAGIAVVVTKKSCGFIAEIDRFSGAIEGV
jgi:septum formation inhibitor-activating ATPase MinD